MASKDGNSSIKAAVALNTAALSGVGRTAGNVVDTNGFESVEVLVQSGAITSGVFTPVLEEGDASNFSDAATATKFVGTVAAFTKSPTDDSNKVKRFGYAGHRRYVKLSIDKAGTQASGTATLATSLAADEKVTIESVDFTAKAKYASNIVTCASAAAADKITLAGIDFTGRAKYASNIVTCTGVQAGDSVTINGSVFAATSGTPDADEFAIGVSDAATAANLAAAVEASTDPLVVDIVTAANVEGQATVTFTSDEEGAIGNDITLVTSSAGRLAVTTAGGKLAGAYDASANEWPIGTGGSANADSAAALAAAINGASDVEIDGVVTAANVGGQATVTITSDVAGADGNDVTLTSSTGVRLAITTAGGKLAGAYDPASNEWPVESTLALSATALAAAINACEDAAIADVVTASTTGTAVCTITADTGGTGGNSLTLAKTGDHITVSGSGTLSGGVNAVGTLGATIVLGHPRDIEPIP